MVVFYFVAKMTGKDDPTINCSHLMAKLSRPGKIRKVGNHPLKLGKRGLQHCLKYIDTYYTHDYTRFKVKVINPMKVILTIFTCCIFRDGWLSLLKIPHFVGLSNKCLRHYVLLHLHKITISIWQSFINNLNYQQKKKKTTTTTTTTTTKKTKKKKKQTNF